VHLVGILFPRINDDAGSESLQTVFTIDEVGKSEHNKTLSRYKESKDRQHVSALLFYNAIIRSDMMN